MIAKLKGFIDSVDGNQIILDVHGVGYLVNCSQKTVDNVPKEGEPTTLFIETVVREDAFILYGFHNKDEKACFTLLTSVQGVGKKVGQAILSALDPSEIYQAIAHGEKAIITRADGVGPKLASRILNELKDKVGDVSSSLVSNKSKTVSLNDNIEDALSALVALGYKRNEIILALGSFDNNSLSTQDLIRECLNKLSRRAS